MEKSDECVNKLHSPQHRVVLNAIHFEPNLCLFSSVLLKRCRKGENLKWRRHYAGVGGKRGAGVPVCGKNTSMNLWTVKRQPPPGGLQSMDTHTLMLFIDPVYDWPRLKG